MASESSSKSNPVSSNKQNLGKNKKANFSEFQNSEKHPMNNEALALQEILDQDSPKSAELAEYQLEPNQINQKEIKKPIRFNMSMSLFTLEEEDYDETPMEERPGSRSSRSRSKGSVPFDN